MELINEVEILNNELKSLESQIKVFKFIKIIGFILYIVIIGHFILQKVNQKLYELNNRKITLTNSTLKKINSLEEHLLKSYNNFLKQDTYLIYPLKERFLNETTNTLHLLTKISYIIRELEDFYQTILSKVQSINNLKNEITNYNDEFVTKRKKEYKELFKTNYGELDEYQQEAIIRDDKYNLVVAGAGSGKTEVLIRRIAYLIKRKPDTIKNNRILAIAFQNKASNEIKIRLSKNFDVDVDVRTFHSLGKKILEDSGKKISLIFNGDNFEKEFNNFIKKQYEFKLKDKEFKKLLLEYVKYINDDEIEKQAEDFESKEEYVNYNKNLRFTSLNETKVKSEFEREVMNFFLTHKINGKRIEIKYEEKADWLKYTNTNGQEIEVSPDFYFPVFNTYLECWALDKNNKVPNWFEGTNPTEKYINTMNIKKDKFKEQDKHSLIEISYGEYQTTNNFTKLIENKFMSILNKKFPDKKFELEPMTYDEIINNLWEDSKASINTIPLNIGRFITIAKTYGFNTKTIIKRLDNEKWSIKQIKFTKIALEVFQDYEQILQKEKKIDFSDMINLAVKELKDNKELYKNKFDHILIDEYQDISYQRYMLVNELLNKNPNCKLFVVGDDWQSIMGFSGSNLNYFVNFSKYFENPHRTDLINNYRSIKSIVDCGSDLIKNNGNSQINKKAIAFNNIESQINIFSSLHKKGFERNYYTQITHHCISLIDEKLKEGVKPNEIMILSRIMSNKFLFNQLFEFAKKKGIQLNEYHKEGLNRVNLMSVHKSKGLQAKVVIILDVVQGLYGFPCELENLSIFNIATLNEFENEKEERRLFYVALTRAKEELYIYTMKEKESKFLKEISKYANVEYLGYGYNVNDDKSLNNYL